MDIHEGLAIQQIQDDFSALGFHVDFDLFKMSDFGIAQKRERIIIIGTNKHTLPAFDLKNIQTTSKPKNAKEVLQDLESLQEGDFANHYWSKAKRNKGQGNSVIEAQGLAPTMRAEHHGNIEFHYSLPRRLSAREAARLQSFPDDFVFYPSTSSAYRQIGNAVAPGFAWHIGVALQDFLDQHLKPRHQARHLLDFGASK